MEEELTQRPAGEAEVAYYPDRVRAGDIAIHITSIGFPAEPIDRSTECELALSLLPTKHISRYGCSANILKNMYMCNDDFYCSYNFALIPGSSGQDY